MEYNDKLKERSKRILLSRLRLIMRNPFYGLLLMNVKFGIDDNCETAYTDGQSICFSSNFMDNLSNDELDFVMMHELLHIVLRHCKRSKNYDKDAYNVACDIVVNSNVMYSLGNDPKKITLKKYGELMHLTPKRDEGYKYTAEEVYEMLDKNTQRGKSGVALNGGCFDDHSKWKDCEEDEFEDDFWEQKVKEVSIVIDDVDEKKCGNTPMWAKRILDGNQKAQHDWRTILNNFLCEEINDYSFTPPDKRYEGEFFLPDFNDVDYTVKNILFMIDTSGSMSDKDIKTMYSEILGAISQFNGKLSGYLGFFDAKVIEPKPFCDESEFEIIKAYGGGGTSFQAVIDYVNKYMLDKEINAIIILTDGCAPFPTKKSLPQIPLLWVINNEYQTPPDGKILRVKNL